MKPVIMEIRKKRKGIIRTILDNHRDVWMYRRALNDMLLLLAANKNTDFPFIQRYEDESINEVVRLIIKHKNDLLSATKVAATSE